MNENKKGIIVLVGVILFVILIFFLSLLDSESSKELYKKFEDSFNKEGNSLVVLGRPTCQYCTLLTPSLKEMKERYDFDYVYIDTDKMSSKYIQLIQEKLELKSVSTPYLAIVNKGEVKNAQNGYIDYDELFKFLQDNEIIKTDAKLAMNYIGLEEYQNLLKGDKPSIVVVGQSTCSFCVDAKFVLNKIADEHDVTINYLSVTKLNEEESKTFQNSLDYFKGEWGTPVTLIIKNGKLEASLDGLKSYEEYVKFFKDKGAM